MRNLAKTLVAVTLMTSTSVHSLGIGGIKLRSALNQKLNAEIALVASGGENVSDIRVKLASPAKFDEAGVPWSYFLSKIKFTPVVKADGSIVVTLTSDEALKEPYLNFLLEVSGSSGTLYREFTVLVDPPASYKQPVIPATLPAVQDTRRITLPAKPAVDALPDMSRDAGTSLADTDYSAINEYGPVSKTDTIWSIANAVKTDDATTMQMVIALYEANRGAFARPNINTLMAGEMLSIPDREAVLKYSPRQASARFKQQGRTWQAKPKYAKRKSSSVARQAHVDDAVDASGGQLKLNPPREGDIAGNDVVAYDGSSVATDQKNTTTGSDADLKQRFEHIEKQLLLMQKMLELKDAELATLQNKQLPEMPKSALVDIAPPGTESAADGLPVNPLAPQSPEDMQSSPIVDSAPAVANKPVPESTSTPPSPAVPPVANPMPPVSSPTVTDPFADYYLPAAGIGTALLGLLGLFWWRKRKVEKVVDTQSMFESASQISLPVQDEPELNITKTTATNQPSGYEVGMVGESAFLSEFTPSEFDAFETDQTEIDPVSEADVYLAYGRYQQAEELIRQVIVDHPERNDCKLKLLEIFYASENKPDFNEYVRQLMNDGKQADTGFWAKVVDLAEEFTPGAGALIRTEGAPETSPSLAKKTSNVVALDKVESVSEEVDFDLDSFSEKDVSAQPAVPNKTLLNKDNAATAASASAIFLDNPSDFSEADAASDASLSTNLDDTNALDFDDEALTPFSVDSFASSEDDNSLDFDLNALSSDMDEDEQIEFIDEDDDNAVEFDLNAFALSQEQSADDVIELLDEKDEGNGLDFDLSTVDDTSSSVSTDNASSEAEDDYALDFVWDDAPAGDKQDLDLSLSDEGESALKDFDFSTEGLNVKPASPVSEKALDEADTDEFDFDFNESTSSGHSGTVDVGDLTDNYSAFETKVNLANAYVDMGDVDAAKEIANDLLTGTAEQKKAGQEILEKIS